MGIVNLESCVRQVVRVVNLTAIQAVDAISGDDHASGSRLHDFVARLRIGDLHFILPASTTTPADGKPQARLW